MTDAEGDRRLKDAAAPAAGAVAIVASLIAVSIATGIETSPSSPVSDDLTAPSAAHGSPTAPSMPQPGSGLAGVAFDQGVPGAPNVQMGVEIVVKFKDDSKVKDIIDAFWRDQPNAKSRFETFKARRPELEGLKLDRVTYSNELVLTLEPGQTRSAAAMRELAAKLNGHADISYAEPNMTAQPGAQ